MPPPVTSAANRAFGICLSIHPDPSREESLVTRLILTTMLLLVAVSAHAAVAVRILLGVGDKAPTDWSGGVSARGARIAAVEPWRFDDDDAMQPGNQWKITTHVTRRFGAANAAARTFSANGVVVLLENETEDSVLEVKTPRGTFSVRLNEIPFGKVKSGLDGKAAADRIPPYSRITSDPDEQDYPAAAVD